MTLAALMARAIKDAKSTGYTQQVDLPRGLKVRVRVNAGLLQLCLYRKDQNPSEMEGHVVAQHAGLKKNGYTLDWSPTRDGMRLFLVVNQTMPTGPKQETLFEAPPAEQEAPAETPRFKKGDLITDSYCPDVPFEVLEHLVVGGIPMYRVLFGQIETALRAEVAVRWYVPAPTPQSEQQAPAPITLPAVPTFTVGPHPIRSKVTCRNRAAVVVFSGPELTLVEFTSDRRIVWVPHDQVQQHKAGPLTREGMIQEIVQLDAARHWWWARPEAQSARRGWLSELSPDQLLKEHQLYIRTYRGAM